MKTLSQEGIFVGRTEGHHALSGDVRDRLDNDSDL